MSYSDDTMEKYERSLFDLPADILSLIQSYLFARDRLYFRMTCKICWSLSDVGFHEDSALSRSPCLLIYGYKFLHKFFHPIYNHFSFQPIHGDVYQTNTLNRATLRESKFGWFLMTEGDFSVFFFNPMTNARIQLPDLYEDLSVIQMTFNLPPTELDWEVVGFGHEVEDEIHIFSISRGQDNWMDKELSTEKDLFCPSTCNPVAYKGRYYCLGLENCLLIYHSNTKECTWSTNCYKKSLAKRVNAIFCNSYLVESDGDLLAVFIARDARSIGVYRLNFTLWLFEEIHCLGDKMLYVSRTACFSETAPVSGTGNKIYLPRFHDLDGRLDGLFYSLVTKKFHTFNGYTTDNFNGEQEYPISTWIKPIFDSQATCGGEIIWKDRLDQAEDQTEDEDEDGDGDDDSDSDSDSESDNDDSDSDSESDDDEDEDEDEDDDDDEDEDLGNYEDALLCIFK